MDSIAEKALIAIIPPTILLALKWINYVFNITGDRDKTSKEKIELLKSTLEISNSLHIAEYKILYEETFSLIYKKTLHFDEIKKLLHTKSPKKAITYYLKARPLVEANQKGEGFTYVLWNRIRFGNRLYWFPAYRIILLLLYLVFGFTGAILLILQLKKYISLSTIVNKNILFDYIIITLLTGVAITLIAIGLKCISRAFGAPLRRELRDALENLKDRELVIVKPRESTANNNSNP